jgi:esterase/lipase superfamily enzyme
MLQPPTRDGLSSPLEAATVEEPKSQAEAETGPHEVQVFYATDRRPLGEATASTRLRLFAGVFAAGLLALLLLVATIFFRRRWILGTLTVIAAVFAVLLFQAANIKLQRSRRFAENEDRVYGNDRHETAGGYRLELGIAEVSIPPDHRVGKLESPSILRLEFRETAARHVVLQRVMLKSDEEFYEQLGTRIQQSEGKQAFVFVHGYNVMFDDAVKRTAQIAHDLRFAGAPICYSWPSKGGLAEYTRDESNVTWTVIHLEKFLNDVVHRTGARTVHLVAHSMGNRALLQALERIALQQNAAEPVFGQLVLAAPDVDAAEFRDRYAPTARRIARQVTLYASSNDQALLASTKVHGHTRAGLSDGLLTVVPGVDTIDVSPIDTSLIGHSYYGNNPEMIRDMRALVELSEPAARRPWLEQIADSPEFIYWMFRQGFENGPVAAGSRLVSPQQ